MSWLSDLTDSVRRSDIGQTVNRVGMSVGNAVNANPLGGSKSVAPNAGSPNTNGLVLNSPEWNDAVNGRVGLQQRILNANIDAQSQQELLTMTDYNATVDELNKAIAGEGKYKTRKRNYDAVTIFSDRPGAAQLFASGESRANAARGLLSPSPQTALLTPGG